tara:strand:- start:866 stop:2176 length:1311 start_codon:yes stop_codon:yes gene_type:complete
MAEINDLSVDADSNTARFPENQLPSTLNNGARSLEACISRWHKDTNGSVAVAGTNTYTATINADTGFALYDGFEFVGDFANGNTGAATINLTPHGGSALGAKAIKKNVSTALASGDIAAGAKVALIYDGTNFQMMSPVVSTASYSDPLTTRGDLVKRGASATERLAIGSANTVLTTDGTDPAWSTVATAMIADDAVSSAKIADDAVVQAAIADEAVNEARLQVSNAPTNGYFLSAQSGNTGGLTWAEAGGGAWTFISATTISDDATYSFTSFNASAYDAYVFMLINVTPVTDGVYLDMLTSTDGGSSYDTGGSDYSWVFNSSTINGSDGGVDGDVGFDAAKISLTGNSSGAANQIGSATGEHGVGGNIWLFDPASTKNTQITWDLMYQSSTPESVVQIAKGGAVRDSAADVDAIRLSFSSGNIETGQINVYGVKNA